MTRKIKINHIHDIVENICLSPNINPDYTDSQHIGFNNFTKIDRLDIESH